MPPSGSGSRTPATATRIARLTLLAGGLAYAGCGGGGVPAGPPCANASAPTQIASGPGSLQAIDVHDTTLLAAFADAGTGEGSIVLVDLATGAARTLATRRISPLAPSATSRFAYWLDNGSPEAQTPMTLMRAPLDGSAGAEVVVPVTVGPTDTVVAGDTLFFGRNGALASLAPDTSVPVDHVPEAYPLRLASAADHVYWTKCGEGVERMPTGGGPVERLTDMSCSMPLTTDGTEVYFVDFTNGGLRRAPASGGAPTIVVTDATISGTANLVIDDQSAYYVAGAGLYRVSRAGGDPERFVAGTVTDLAADDACVYWGEATKPAVFAMRK